MLGKFCESSIEALLIWIIVSPFLLSFVSILGLIILRLIRLTFALIYLMIGSECCYVIASPSEGRWDFCLML